MIASKRKPTVPCELCRWFRESRHEGVMMCALHLHVATDRDGCTFGEYDEEGKR